MRLRSCAVHLNSAALVAIFAVTVGGCQLSQLTTNAPDITGSLGASAEAKPDDNPQRKVEIYGDRYRSNPQDAEAARNYGQALRQNNQRQQAVALLERATIAHPEDKALIAEYGRALAEDGKFQRAFDILSRAHSPENPDWRILSVQGVTLDLLNRHDEARRYYASALKIVPDEPTVLSNLGLSYLLSKDLPKAEAALRKAYDQGNPDARVRQNLALAIGLQGRLAEAENLVKVDLPADKTKANVAYFRKILEAKAQRNTANE